MCSRDGEQQRELSLCISRASAGCVTRRNIVLRTLKGISESRDAAAASTVLK